ncbi:MAG: ThiF family adenylyltransferase [Neptuniibacter sp.]
MFWWEKWPDRKIGELERFKVLGFKPREVKPLKAEEAENLIIEIDYCLGGKKYPLTVRFPPEYPFFCGYAYLDPKVEVLTRHHNPYSGELCLLGNPGEAWKPSVYMADLINEEMPRLIDTVEDPDSEYTKEVEVFQGEPVSGYVSRDDRTLIIIEDVNIPNGVERGTFIAKKLPHKGQFRYVLIELFDSDRNSIFQADEAIQKNYQGGEVLRGFWAKWDKTNLGKKFSDPFKIEDWKTIPLEVAPTKLNSLRAGRDKKSYLFATVYDEETQKGVIKPAWAVVQVSPKLKQNGQKVLPMQRIHPAPYGKYDRSIRTPELLGLSEKKVTIIGAGMLGSQIAIQLARGGVGHITIIDHDFVELTTCIRYSLGAEYAHWVKTDAIQDYICKNYPCTQVEAYRYRFGASCGYPVQEKAAMIMGMKNSDLIIDAAAERPVSHYLSHWVRDKRIPILNVTTRPGSWGGEIWMSYPDECCWTCFDHYRNDGQLKPANGDDVATTVQPGGCASPTLPGNGFDSDMISLQTVKLAVGALLVGVENGYPLPDWNALTINLRGAVGELILPEYNAQWLTPHPECSCQESE